MTDIEILRNYVIYVQNPVVPLRAFYAIPPGDGPAGVWLDLLGLLPVLEESVLETIRLVAGYPHPEPTLCFQPTENSAQFRVIVHDTDMTVGTGMPKDLQETLTRLTGKPTKEEQI